MLLSKDWKLHKSGTHRSIQLILEQNGGFKLKTVENEIIGWILINQHLALGYFIIIMNNDVTSIKFF